MNVYLLLWENNKKLYCVLIPRWSSANTSASADLELLTIFIGEYATRPFHH